jgi:carboxymethylenebutenolidase
MNDVTEIAGLRDYPMARRGVLMTGLISGFTVATQRVEAQAIHTDPIGIEAAETQIATTDGMLPAYYAKPARNGPFPIILVNEEIFGVHEYIKDVCRRLAKVGYLAVATEYYARIGDLSKMTDVKQILSDVILKAPDAQYMSDLDSTAAWAQHNDGSATRLGVMGFCRGYGPLGGQVSPIQPQTALDIAGQIECPFLGLYGGQDQAIPVDLVRQAEAKAKAAHKIIDIVIYADAPHGFHADYRPSYRQVDAEDAWQRTLTWFHRFGV